MYDVLIVGGGPAGLSAALVLGRALHSVLMIDSGEPRNARAQRVNGYLGAEGRTPVELRAAGRRQIEEVGVRCLEGKVTAASTAVELKDGRSPTMFRIKLEDGSEHVGRKMLFATGIRDCVPDIPGIQECYGVSVHHCPYCDGYEHRNSRLIALGGAPGSAARLGLMLTQWSSCVVVATNGQTIEPEDRERLLKNGVSWREEEVVRLEHQNGKLHALVSSHGQRLEADAIFFSASSAPCCELPSGLGCRTKERGRIETTDRQGTGVPGVFLAGDADGDVEFAIVAAAEGAVAATAINKELLQEDLRFREGSFAEERLLNAAANG